MIDHSLQQPVRFPNVAVVMDSLYLGGEGIKTELRHQLVEKTWGCTPYTVALSVHAHSIGPPSITP